MPKITPGDTKKDASVPGKSSTTTFSAAEMQDGNVETGECHRGEVPMTSADQPKKPQERQEYLKGVKLVLIVGAVTLVCFLILLDAAVIVTAIPMITGEFHSIHDIGWYGSSYLLANCALQPLTGKFYTHFPTKPVFLTSIFVFELGSLICGLSNSSGMLIGGRTIAGLGGSGVVNGGLTILTLIAPAEKRPILLGIMMGVAQVGTAVGPLIGGALTEYSTWRWCFYLNLPIGGAVSLLLLLINIPSKVTEANKIHTVSQIYQVLDLPGFAIFAPCTTMFLLAIQWGGTAYAWSSATIIGLLIGSFGLLVVFLLWEKRVGDKAMIPLAMVAKTRVWASCLSQFFLMGNYFVVTYYLPLWFQVVLGKSPADSGIAMFPIVLAQIFAAVISGALVGKLGYYLPFTFGGSALAAIGCGLMSTFTPDIATGKWIGYQIIAGFGRGLGIQMPLIATQTALPPSQHALGISLIIFTQYLGGSLFAAIAQVVFIAGITKSVPAYAPGADISAILSVGAAEFRSVVPEAQVEGVRMAYNVALTWDFYLAVGTAAGIFVVGWGMGWVKIGGKKEGDVEGGEESEKRSEKEKM